MTVSVFTCVPSGLLEGVGCISGYMCCCLIEIVKRHLSGGTEINRKISLIIVGVHEYIRTNFLLITSELDSGSS